MIRIIGILVSFLLIETSYSFAESHIKFSLNGYLQNIGLFKTDRDFDPTEPYYNPDGQTVGFLATFFDPKITVQFSEKVKMYYEIEIGTNVWSRNRIEWNHGEVKDFFNLKHRQIYVEANSERLRVLRIGYQYFSDPTGLFINHWLGGLYLEIDTGKLPLQIFGGQLPDTTYEGWDFEENNFTNDIFLLFIGTEQNIQNISLKYGIVGFYDGEVIRKHKWLLSPQIHIAYGKEGLEIGGDLALQFGRSNHTSINNGNEYLLAGAVQFYIARGLGISGWGKLVDGRIVPGRESKGLFKNGWYAGILILSPDDKYDHNGINYAFQYSGRPLSRTLMLTEDEFRDLGLNLDEKIGETTSKYFTLIRSGILILEGSYYRELSDKLLLSVIGGAGVTLQGKNSLGRYFLAGEADFHIQYSILNNLFLDVINSFLVPGKAGSAFINEINKSRTYPIYQIEISLNLVF